MKKKVFWFHWRCRRCGEAGGTEDNKLWLYCPYCGGGLDIKIKREFEVEG